MAEVNTAEAEANADAAFGAGFGVTPPAVIPPAKVEDKPVIDPAKPEAKPAPLVPGPKPEKPEYVRVTRQDWDRHNAMFGKVASLEGELAKMKGSMPNGEAIIQQAIEKVRAETPAGQAVEFSKEDLAEIAEDYPDMAERLLKVLNRGKVKGTGPSEPAKAPSSGIAEPIDIGKAVEAEFTKREAKQKADALEAEMKALAEAHPKWRETVGAPAVTGGEPVQTEWRKWATTNDQAALTTDSPAELQASIAKFTASQTAPVTPPKPDKGEVRRAVIADAATPKLDGNAPPLNQPPSAEDAFKSGFTAVRRH